MIAIGTDIVEVARVEGSWARFGDRFAARILTADELAACRAGSAPARFLARRFAAKEAMAKALGCGIGVRLSWQDLSVAHTDEGAPLAVMAPRARAIARGLGGERMLLSISDERAYAVAFAALVA